jgi:hypothetical protein
LPPYDVLDRILKAYIEDLRSSQEIADKYGFELKLVREIALLVDRSEYKRKQAAPDSRLLHAHSASTVVPDCAAVYSMKREAALKKLLVTDSLCGAGLGFDDGLFMPVVWPRLLHRRN